MKLRSKILGINMLALAVLLVAVLYLTYPRILESEGQDSVHLFIVILFAVGLASILISGLLLEVLVVRRISGLTAKVNRIERFRSYYEELHYTGKDEVAVLANATNQMLQRIVSSTNEVGSLNAELQEEKAGAAKLVEAAHTAASSEKRLEASVSNLSLGFIMTDQRDTILLLNERARQILASGYLDPSAAEAALHAPWTVAEIDKQLGADFGFVDKLHTGLAGRKTVDYADITYGEHILRIIISPILESADSSLGCVVVLEDVTEKKVLERTRDEFFSIASHELRTPLTAIRGNTALLKQFYEPQIKDETFHEMIDDIHTSSVRLIGIVNDFLDASRLEQGKIKMKLEAFDLTKILETVVYETGALAEEKGNQIVVDKTLTNVPEIYADKDRIKQVVYNLVGNAMKFTEKGTITITAVPQGNLLKVLVSDTGPGISDADQKLLFHKFQQVGNNPFTRETSRGTGLGLYISKLLIERMGGAIALEHSELGKGTTFSFTVPIASGK